MIFENPVYTVPDELGTVPDEFGHLNDSPFAYLHRFWYGSLVRFFGAVNSVIVNVVIPKPLAQLRNGDYMQELNSAKNSTASHVVITVPFANSVTRENFVINTFVIKTYFTFVAYMHVYLNIFC